MPHSPLCCIPPSFYPTNRHVLLFYCADVELHGVSIGLQPKLTTHQCGTSKVTASAAVPAQPGLEILRTLEIEQRIGQGF